MSDLPSGFPRWREKKVKKFGGMSAKTVGRIVERKEVIKTTHLRAKGKCEAEWIAPHIRCSKVRHCDEKWTRGRSGGVSAYDDRYTQSICSRCDFCKENEVWASEILGLYGDQGKNKHIPITEADIERAKLLFAACKERLHF